MRNSFEGTGEDRYTPEKENISPIETAQDLREKIALLLEASERQPEMLALVGKNLGLTPAAVAAVFAEKDYTGRLADLQDRMKRASEVLQNDIDNTVKS